MTAEVDPWAVRRALFRPSSILWDGMRTWVQIEGTSAEVTVEARGLPGAGWEECPAPSLPEGRSSMEPGDIRSLTKSVAPGWLAELGTGTVHGLLNPERAMVPVLSTHVRDMNRTVKDAFDPEGRCNPGVLPW
jgi:hypothetical protein